MTYQQTIVHAALPLFLRYGYRKTSMRISRKQLVFQDSQYHVVSK